MIKYRWLKYCTLSKRVYRCKSRSFRFLVDFTGLPRRLTGGGRRRWGEWGSEGRRVRSEGYVSATCEELTGDGFSVGRPNSLCRLRRRSTPGSSTSALEAFRYDAFDFASDSRETYTLILERNWIIIRWKYAFNNIPERYSIDSIDRACSHGGSPYVSPNASPLKFETSNDYGSYLWYFSDVVKTKQTTSREKKLSSVTKS